MYRSYGYTTYRRRSSGYDNYLRNRRAFERSKETNGFKGWRRAQYNAQDGHCAWCYKKVAYEDMDVDHIVPLAYCSLSNPNSFNNLVLACHECNRNRKADSKWNETSYKNRLNELSIHDKQHGFAPQRVYWERPKWIGPNKYCSDYKYYQPIDIPIEERNVWTAKAPIVADGSLKQSNLSYYYQVVKESIMNFYKNL